MLCNPLRMKTKMKSLNKYIYDQKGPKRCLESWIWQMEHKHVVVEGKKGNNMHRVKPEDKGINEFGLAKF